MKRFFKRFFKIIYDFIDGFGPEIFGNAWLMVLFLKIFKADSISPVVKASILVIGLSIIVLAIFGFIGWLLTK